MRHYGQQHRVILGAVVIGFGVLALIDSLQLFGNFDIISFWPTLFILAGALKLSQSRSHHSNIVGGVLIAIGVFLTADHLGLFYFHMRSFWPLLVIAAGVLMLSRGMTQKQSGWHIKGGGIVPGSDANAGGNPGNAPYGTPGSDASGADALAYMNVAAIMSGNKLRNDSQDFRGGDVCALMGAAEIDLRQASMTAEATIQVFAMWGAVILKVPSDWTVISRTVPLLGGVDDRSVPPGIPGKRLIIDGVVIMGGVEVKN